MYSVIDYVRRSSSSVADGTVITNVVMMIMRT